MSTLATQAPTVARAGRTRAASLFVMACLPLCIGSAFATPFIVTGTDNSAKTLGGGANQAGVVNAGGTLSVGGSTVAVTITGNGATLTNLGTVEQTGTGRAIRDKTGVTGLAITNGSSSNGAASISTANGDVVQVGKASGTMTLDNYGRMTSTNSLAKGAQVVDFNAINGGSNVVNNHAGAVMTAYEADAVRPGVNGVVNNAGTIRSVAATGGGSDGIDAQENGGVQVFNAATGLVDGGRHGITGGQASAASLFTVSVTNEAGGVVQGNNGAGINIDGINAGQTATIVNHGTISGNGRTGDGDGIDVDGLVNVANTGIIRSIDATAVAGEGTANSEGLSVGGGTIVNSGVIEGLVAAGNANAVGRGITLTGNDITSGPAAGTREGLYGDALVVNQRGGTVRGDSDSAIVAIGAASGFTVTVQNNAGAALVGGGAATAAVRTGLDNDTIRNAGVINGASSGLAIDMGGGNNTLYISGGEASVRGAINGGSGGSNRMVVDAGAGQGFAYTGAISNFDKLEIQSGTVTLSGISSYTGTTEIDGGTLVLDGDKRLSAASALALGGGGLTLMNAGAGGQSFSSLSLLADGLLDLGTAHLTFGSLGAVVAGTTLTVLGQLGSGASDYAFRFLGDLAGNADFQALIGNTVIDGAQARYSFDGTYTLVARGEVPEPATPAMMLMGLGMVGLLLRKRRAAA